MRLLRSGIIAFALYSRIPMPRVEWTKENMKYAMCFFPWVGAVIGVLFGLWGTLGRGLGLGNGLHTVILLLLPVVLTGGIHLDGLLDTADALGSHQTRERRLLILKDPNAGAFAVIWGIAYFLAYFGLLSELSRSYVPVPALGFFLTRAFSGYGITRIPCAKDSGLAAAFSNGDHKKLAGRILAAQGLICAGFMVFCRPLAGGAAVLTAAACYLYYRAMAKKKFGGITGDLAGWFLQVCELAVLAVVIVVQCLEGGGFL